MKPIKLTQRMAVPADLTEIERLIRELAAYEKMSDQVSFTTETLYDSLFIKKQAEVLLVCTEESIVGYAIFFTSFSTFVGAGCLYLEDLYVSPAYRKMGIGKSLFVSLAAIAKKRTFRRLDFACLKWNQSSLDFYQVIGARIMDEWHLLRLEEEALLQLVELNTQIPWAKGSSYFQ